MIKFWKSAAKGKSGCPVRPPEQVGMNSNLSINLSKNIIGNDNDLLTNVFEKKSSLNLDLKQILSQEKAVKYFTQYMNEIGQHVLIKCWLELENFKTVAANTSSHNKNDPRGKICRTKSFEQQSESQKVCKKDKSYRFSWRDNSNIFINTNFAKQYKADCVASSCGNLTEHPGLLRNCDICRGKNCNDITELAISLFKKYIALEAPQKIDLPDDVRKVVISNICHPEGNLKADCFKPVQKYLLDIMDNNYFLEFQKNPLYVKAQVDTLTSGVINLGDILFNESILFYFTEYLEQESCSILLQFLISVMHFRDNLTSDNPPSAEEAQSDAISLYDKYFSLQATNPIGFSGDVRAKIESDICGEGPLATSFDLPFKIVYKTLDCYVKTFLESEIYYKYLSEIIHSIDQRWSSNSKPHSDCSSEFSVSTQNTLLAMGDPMFNSKKRNNSVPDMTIDSNQLYNADALWQRKKQDGLSLGRINSLGRFESKFEPDPDKKDKSVFKKMVNKFVPHNNSKVDEEMAWQIAHMIVKDVTDLTMAPPEEHDHDE